MRTLKSALDNSKNEFSESRAVVPWRVAHAGSLANEFAPGADGLTAREWCRGRQFAGTLLERGECVMYLVPQMKGMRKLEPSWGSGVFSGIHERSEELLVGTKDGAARSREHRSTWGGGG